MESRIDGIPPRHFSRHERLVRVMVVVGVVVVEGGGVGGRIQSCIHPRIHL